MLEVKNMKITGKLTIAVIGVVAVVLIAAVTDILD